MFNLGDYLIGCPVFPVILDYSCNVVPVVCNAVERSFGGVLDVFDDLASVERLLRSKLRPGDTSYVAFGTLDLDTGGYFGAISPAVSYVVIFAGALCQSGLLSLFD